MQAQAIPFRKMNGLGNDFVVLDARARALPLGADALRAIADRKEGIGCDQIIALEPSQHADVFMRIWNADGGEVGACGNAARCVAGLIAAERGRPGVSIETESAVHAASVNRDGSVTIRCRAVASHNCTCASRSKGHVASRRRDGPPSVVHLGRIRWHRYPPVRYASPSPASA